MSSSCSWHVAGRHVHRVAVHGDLDHDTADALLAAVDARLAGESGLRELHVDCAGIGFVDTHGLSVLLMVHRRVRAAGARFVLLHRTAALERLLALTGTLEHLTADDAARRERTPDR